ncbi:DUF1553 domain-containing protein [Candidatus Poribacteria bacterium]|nr:DUF1553 domain-containing protein [Candidatus Poribacteria bacterium]
MPRGCHTFGVNGNSVLRFPIFILIALAVCAAWLQPGSAAAQGRLTSGEIDRIIEAAQARAGVEPASLASDEAFLRRLCLDVRGVIPSVEQTIQFLNDKDPAKRQRWIDLALDTPERGQHWANYWDKLLVGVLEQPQNAMAQLLVKKPWRDWAAAQFNANVPYDQFMRSIVTAEGVVGENPAAMPLARWRDAPENMAGTISRVFLGKQIQCAQCHTHKTDPSLTQEKFWEFASFFKSTRVILLPAEDMGRRGIAVYDHGGRWQTEIPESDPKVLVSPRYLDGTPATQDLLDENGKPIGRREAREKGRKTREVMRTLRESGGRDLGGMEAEAIPRVHDSRRQQLASFIESNDRRQFAANLVNRIWARCFGRGIVEPVDDWTTQPEPSHPELLEALTTEFIASGYDVKHIERLVLNTRAYQRSSEPAAASAEHPELFAHAAIRPLSPDQLFDSIVQSTYMGKITREDTSDTRLQRLRDRYAAQFLFTFGSDEMEWTTSFENSIPQALFLLNDEVVSESVTVREDLMLGRIAETTDDPEKAVDYLYLAALSRRPTEAEREFMGTEYASASKSGTEETRQFFEDAFWALLNTTEFMTNH